MWYLTNDNFLQLNEAETEVLVCGPDEDPQIVFG